MAKTPAKLVDRLLAEDDLPPLDDDKIPPLEQLYKFFADINADCASSRGEQVVPFTDIDYYAQQIDATWEGHPWAQVEAAAKALLAYSKEQGYVLPERTVPEEMEGDLPDDPEAIDRSANALLNPSLPGMTREKLNAAREHLKKHAPERLSKLPKRFQ